DDDVLGDVHETTGEVAGVRGPQRRVGQALPRTVGGDEVLEHRQALAVVGLDRTGDDLALRVGHEATHPGDLAHLHPVAAGPRTDHRVDGVLLGEVRPHRDVDLVGRLGPDLDELGTPLVVGDETAVVLAPPLAGAGFVRLEDLRLRGRGDHVGDRDRPTRTAGPA